MERPGRAAFAGAFAHLGISTDSAGYRKLDKTHERQFRSLGSIAYDDRILRYGSDYVSIWTMGGRQGSPFLCGERQRILPASRQGESDLVYRDGDWYLLATVNVIEPPTGEVDDRTTSG